MIDNNNIFNSTNKTSPSKKSPTDNTLNKQSNKSFILYIGNNKSELNNNKLDDSILEKRMEKYKEIDNSTKKNLINESVKRLYKKNANDISNNLNSQSGSGKKSRYNKDEVKNQIIESVNRLYTIKKINSKSPDNIERDRSVKSIDKDSHLLTNIKVNEFRQKEIEEHKNPKKLDLNKIKPISNENALLKSNSLLEIRKNE